MLGEEKKPRRLLVKNKSRYVNFKNLVIRTSNHLPDSDDLIRGKVTGSCKNIYLIFVKRQIDTTLPRGQKLDDIIRFAESDDIEKRGILTDIVSDIGKSAGKNIAYKIVDDIDLDGLKILEEKINFRVKNFGFKSGEDEYDYDEPWLREY